MPQQAFEPTFLNYCLICTTHISLLLLPEFKRAMAPVHLPLSCYKVSNFCYLRNCVKVGRAPNSLPIQASSQNYWHSLMSLPLILCDLGQVTFFLWESLHSLLVLVNSAGLLVSARPGLCRMLAKRNHFVNAAILTWGCQVKQTAQLNLNIPLAMHGFI